MEGHTPPTDGAPDGAPLVIEVNADTRGKTGSVFAGPAPVFDLTVRMEVPPWAHHDTDDVVGPVDPGTWAQRLALTVAEAVRREPLNVVDELRDQDRRIDLLTEVVGQLQEQATAQAAALATGPPPWVDSSQGGPLPEEYHVDQQAEPIDGPLETDDAPGGAEDPESAPPPAQAEPPDDHPF